MISSNGILVFAQDINKDETVYSILKSNGDVDSNVVSTWIKGNSKLEKVRDKSNLVNIINLKGDEKPVKDGENIIWNINEDMVSSVKFIMRTEDNKNETKDDNIDKKDLKTNDRNILSNFFEKIFNR